MALNSFFETSLYCIPFHSKKNTNSNDSVNEVLAHTEYSPLCANNYNTTSETCLNDLESFKQSHNFNISSPSTTYVSNEDNANNSGCSMPSKNYFF